jgi:PadR family transcriptional regulator PadR
MTILSKDRLHGTLDALVLKTLAYGPSHGYAVARSIEQATDDAIQVEEGSLYPALYRMEKRGWIEADWGKSEVGRKAKIYRLTNTGRKQLRLETAEWSQFATAVSRILSPRA